MVREVKEELGIDVKFEMIVNFKEITRFRNDSIHFYYLGIVTIEDEMQEMKVDQWEIEEVKWADAEFIKYVLDNDLNGSPSFKDNYKLILQGLQNGFNFGGVY